MTKLQKRNALQQEMEPFDAFCCPNLQVVSAWVLGGLLEFSMQSCMWMLTTVFSVSKINYLLVPVF